MTRKTNIIMAAIAVAAIAVIAIAKFSDAKAADWNGCYGGVNVGYGGANTDATIDAGFASVGVSGLGGDGAVAGLSVGCDVQVQQRFVIGLFGDYTWHNDTEFTASASLPPLFSGTVASASIDSEWSIGGRAGFLATPDTLLYGLVGYTRGEMSSISLLPGTPMATSFGTPDFAGIVWGAGVETQLGSGWAIKAEYRYADYDSETVGIVPGVDLKLDPDVQSGRLGVVYRFNTPTVLK